MLTHNQKIIMLKMVQPNSIIVTVLFKIILYTNWFKYFISGLLYYNIF